MRLSAQHLLYRGAVAEGCRRVDCDLRPCCQRPNKRLKLAGDDRFKGSGVLCPSGHGLSSTSPCAGGRVARSLSAIR